MDKGPSLFLSAGEVSGDMHGAALARALLALRPDVRLVGVGGERMAQAGVRLVADVTGHSAVGLTEQLPHLRPVLAAFNEAERALAAERPAAVVLIDFQGANMGLARKARALKLRTVYYILPQEWLWGLRGGAAKVARSVDRLLAVFEAEAEAYRAAGGHVTYVGHPLIDMLVAPREDAAPGPEGLTVALLPGSRPQEVATLLPRFLAAARLIAQARPDARFVLPAASEALRPRLEAAVAEAGVAVTLVAGRSAATLATADVAIVASGTATLEAAVLGVPCVAAYRVSRLTAFLAKRLLRVRHVTLPNIVAGEAIVTELLQGHATPERLAAEALRLLDGPARALQLAGYARVREKLGGPGALDRAARAVLEEAGLAVEPVGACAR